MTPPTYWWAALAVAGMVTVLLATDPLKRESWQRVTTCYAGVLAALGGVAGMLVELWRLQ